MMKQIIVRQKAIQSIQRKHPWVFSGGIDENKYLEEGDLVRLTDAKQNFLAVGYYSKGASIAVRILSFEDVEIDSSFWHDKLQNALEKRLNTLEHENIKTNAFRLIHGEGDDLPGLIIDIYNTTAVIQCHSIGIWLMKDKIGAELQKIRGWKIDAIYVKSKETLKQSIQLVEDHFIVGNNPIVEFLENGIVFQTDLANSQKTGFFLDQRNNRKLLGEISKNKTVLNAFCYTGGFSLYSLLHGATKVVSVDYSKSAIAQLEINLGLNHISQNHVSICDDAMHFFKDKESECFDIVVIDPPAFAKSLAKKHNAVSGYKRLNALAIEKVKKGGMLFTFSCSQVVDDRLFQNTVIAACIESGRKAQIIHKLMQGQDHPINVYHPEGSYLKGLVLLFD